MTKAAGGGMMEVELGQLAQQNAKSERVKNFGQMMVRDHSAANDDLKAVARQKNVTLPESMPAEHQHHKDDLSKKKGADFDKAYIKMMVDDHKKDIDEFEKMSKNASDPDVKNFATQKLPTLKTHLDSAQAIWKDMK
jgi:putative membrane protein